MVEIVYEDKDIIVVVKPPGMPSQKDLSKDKSVYQYVCEHTGQDDIGLIQRLDRPVGGIMVLTKSTLASKVMTKAVKENLINKHYLALANGYAKVDDELIHYISKVRGNKAIVSRKPGQNGKKAHLSYNLLAREESGDNHLSLLDVKLYTGRFHQIRAQLSFGGLPPLVGDTKYNGSYANKRGWFNIGLYAYRLEFPPHPRSGEAMRFKSVCDHEPFDIFEDFLDTYRN